MKYHDILGIPEHASRQAIDIAYARNLSRLQAMENLLTAETFEVKSAELDEAWKNCHSWHAMSLPNKTTARLKSYVSAGAITTSLSANGPSGNCIDEFCCCSPFEKCANPGLCCEGYVSNKSPSFCPVGDWICNIIFAVSLLGGVGWILVGVKDSLKANRERHREKKRQKELHRQEAINRNKLQRQEAINKKVNLLQNCLKPALHYSQSWNNGRPETFRSMTEIAIKTINGAGISEKAAMLNAVKHYLPNLKKIYFDFLSACDTANAELGEQLLNSLDPEASDYLVGSKALNFIAGYASIDEPSFSGLSGKHLRRDQALLKLIDDTDPEAFRRNATTNQLPIILWYLTLKRPFDKQSYESVLRVYDRFIRGDLLHIDAAASLQVLESQIAGERPLVVLPRELEFFRNSPKLPQEDLLSIVRANKTRLDFFKKHASAEAKKSLQSVARWAENSSTVNQWENS